MLRRIWSEKSLAILIFMPTLTEWIEEGRFPLTARALITDIVLTTVVVAIVYVIVKQKTQLLKLSKTDKLTGAKNRTAFDDEFKIAVGRSERLKELLTLIYLDIDNFKQVNDTYGHSRGDDALIDLVAGVTSHLRASTDQLYRVGGDEFVILLSNKTIEEQQSACRKLNSVLEDQNRILGTVDAGLSYGMTQMRPPESAIELLKRADDMMYDKKCAHQAKAGYQLVH